MEVKGEIYRVSGPVVTAIGLQAKMYDLVKVGNEGLMGEVIQILGPKTIIQVYEETAGIKPGEPCVSTGSSLSVELGPGLLSSIYDGVQRPLHVLLEKMGSFIQRGVSADGLDHKKLWDFKPIVKKGDSVKGGDVIGVVQETVNIEHKIMVPPDISGTISDIKSGNFTVVDTICTLTDGTELQMMQRWPVRRPRPVKAKLTPTRPLVTGMRILDGLFPVAKGGTAAIPGPFGSGKTVTQQSLAKWSDTEIVVYIGCGERGNEMADVLSEFPELEDPQTGRPLMERTVLIANTSNMPVAAREASVYTGITIAEYYRDMGLDVSLMADSTSRWAEAMREISSRLEEMPGEEGYPAYLSARLAEFYERAGVAESLCGETGSITVIGAVSPPGGDFSEPVTQNTLRIVKVFWALDAKLSQRRHFPAINWLNSYSLYKDSLNDWFADNVAPDYVPLRERAMEMLQTESELQEIVQLVGSDALPDDQQLLLEITRMLREIFLQQNAFHPVDAYSPFDQQYKILKAIMKWGDAAMDALKSGVPVTEIIKLESKNVLAKVKYEEKFDESMNAVLAQMDKEFASLRGR
ncbi:MULTISPECIES: ATP synthase subunit A [Methanosarcina]|uniref:A-type ATP synthase subunit A n=4 Tax=Methanosarcina barkeri TaxID=2208 RepID=AATA_METBA|nr:MULTISPECIES: ATP synthase subunit A [Methanosarcina]P22662.1 RecName: Full=V-type ATP synthase alpha chain; AltName: Full=V-ATPase subunit A [Methanosarcina barkeri]AAA72215.1 ATPase alpha subunit [Methanosarcina barkeri]AKJ39092.1 A1A0 archaeal ATP synthase subunit A AhaA [Methanosarcina barkeri CM1]OED12687.1 ATP synthase archaeal, A subunit [Methanosarcina sp. A14]